MCLRGLDWNSLDFLPLLDQGGAISAVVVLSLHWTTSTPRDHCWDPSISVEGVSVEGISVEEDSVADEGTNGAGSDKVAGVIQDTPSRPEIEQIGESMEDVALIVL